jgi:hypothetical protein
VRGPHLETHRLTFSPPTLVRRRYAEYPKQITKVANLVGRSTRAVANAVKTQSLLPVGHGGVRVDDKLGSDGITDDCTNVWACRRRRGGDAPHAQRGVDWVCSQVR